MHGNDLLDGLHLISLKRVALSGLEGMWRKTRNLTHKYPKAIGAFTPKAAAGDLILDLSGQPFGVPSSRHYPSGWVSSPSRSLSSMFSR